jgi:HSP20 family molecular chaperone IbpA
MSSTATSVSATGDDTGVTLQVAVPGVAAADVTVAFSDGNIVVTAPASSGFPQVRVVFAVDATVDVPSLRASVENGVLRVSGRRQTTDERLVLIPVDDKHPADVVEGDALPPAVPQDAADAAEPAP